MEALGYFGYFGYIWVGQLERTMTVDRARLEERTDYGTDLLSSTLLYSTNNTPVKSPHSHTSQTRNQTRKQGDGGGQGQEFQLLSRA